ncbi:regulatory factor, effector binding domain-containing protein [Haematococcus lacustris]
MRNSGLLLLALGVLACVQGARVTPAVGSIAAADDELAAPVTHTQPDFCNNLDCPDFEVLEDYGNGVQLRRYAPSTWANTEVNEAMYEKATVVGFQRLFKYILGCNNLEAKIDMTAPVATHINLDADDEFTDQYSVAFYLPWEYQSGEDAGASKVPGPKDDRVVIDNLPKVDAYVLPFGSYALGFRVKKLAIDFFDFLDQQGITDYYRSSFAVLVYDAPFKPFNRHNEIVVFRTRGDQKAAGW